MSIYKVIALGTLAVVAVVIFSFRVGDQLASKPDAAPPEQPIAKQPVSPSSQPADVAPTTRQDVNENAAPTAPGTQEQISKLLASAQEAMAKYRLTTPPGDNAHHYFEEVLALDPGNKDALTGLDEIVDHYRKMAMEAVREGLYREAEAYVDRGLTVQPNDPGLLQIKKHVAPET